MNDGPRNTTLVFGADGNAADEEGRGRTVSGSLNM
jgi:hypothetical protein